jgi:dihydroorotase
VVLPLSLCNLTPPIIDNQSQVNFVQNKAMEVLHNPIGALTKGSEGKDMAELFDMKNCGAIAFGDYNKSQDNANLLKIACNMYRF